MDGQPPIAFPPFRLDVANEQLWRDTHLIELRRKTFAVLCYLVEHAGQLVTKEEMLEALWPDTVVTDSALKSCVRELRKALDDDDRAPRFIQTVHGRGYRFIASLSTAQPVQSSKFQIPSFSPSPTLSSQYPIPTLVGREVELAQLHGWLDKALSGERQIVFVSGEPGIGKTTLIEVFLSGIGHQAIGNGQPPTINRQQATDNRQRRNNDPTQWIADARSPTSNTQPPTPSLWLGRGQCIEHYGAGEAYMPVLEALGRLCREPSGERLIALLGQHAPTWLVQMPALLSPQEAEMLHRKTHGATQERMLREMAEAVETLTAERPLVLWLEDLHWSDVSTLDLLAVLARRQEGARFLVVGTYRPVEMLVNEHPLRAVKQELQVHKQCEELRLRFLTEEGVAEYLTRRLPVNTEHAELRQVAHLVHQRTEGNPLFMVNMVDYLLAQRGETSLGALLHSLPDLLVVPESIQQMIEKQLDRLSLDKQRILEVASVAGAEFSAATVAACAETEIREIEALCAGLSRRDQFLRTKTAEAWPDGTVAARYGFIHALYQEVLYERVTTGQRIALHLRIGERKECAYGDHTREIAAELAMHFEQGREYQRAVRYRCLAGENALRRAAHVEAIAHLRKGLELLATLPETPERNQQELAFQTTLGSALIGSQGYAATETGDAYTRARQLCQQSGETEQLFPVLHGLWAFYIVRSELKTAHELAEQMLRLAERRQDRACRVEAHWALGASFFCFGNFSAARTHLEQSVVLYDPHEHRSLAFLYGHDPGMSSRCFLAHTLWHLGYPEQALQRSQEAVALTKEIPHPYSLAYALGNTAWFYQLRREPNLTQEHAEAAVALSDEQGFAYWSAYAMIMRGWAFAEQGRRKDGITQMRQGFSVWQATGTELFRPFWLALLAELDGKEGRAEEGLQVLTAMLATIQKTGERFCEAELYRLKGERLLAQKGKNKS